MEQEEHDWIEMNKEQQEDFFPFIKLDGGHVTL